mgnify:CR=1 FL=1
MATATYMHAGQMAGATANDSMLDLGRCEVTA